MTDAPPRHAPVAGLWIALAVVLVLGAFWAVQWLVAPDDEPPPPTFAEQVEALEFVDEVQIETDRVVGSSTARTLESWITLSSVDVMADPGEVAAGLAGVTWGYQQSHWSLDAHPSTADVRHLGPVAQEPVRWWVDAAAGLAEVDPEAALHCDIRDGLLRCEVDPTDPERVLQALADVDGSAIRPWLDGAVADEGTERGFSLRVGDRTFTDAELQVPPRS